MFENRFEITLMYTETINRCQIGKMTSHLKVTELIFKELQLDDPWKLISRVTTSKWERTGCEKLC